MEFIYRENEIVLESPEGGRLACVTFPAVDAETVEIDHTFVDDTLRGQGIAGKLMGVEGGLLRNIIIGVVGSFVGSGLFSLLGFYAYGLLAQILTGVVGACVFIWVGRRLLH